MCVYTSVFYPPFYKRKPSCDLLFDLLLTVMNDVALQNDKKHMGKGLL